MPDDDDELPIIRQHEPLSLLGMLFMTAGINIRRRDDQKELIAALRLLRKLSTMEDDLEFLQGLRTRDAARRDMVRVAQRAVIGTLCAGALAGLTTALAGFTTWAGYLFPHVGGK